MTKESMSKLEIRKMLTWNSGALLFLAVFKTCGIFPPRSIKLHDSGTPVVNLPGGPRSGFTVGVPKSCQTILAVLLEPLA